jgi:Flp pilus assembly protein protease CpaA
MSTAVANPVEAPTEDLAATEWPVRNWLIAAAFPLVGAAPWLYFVGGRDWPAPFASLTGLILLAMLFTVAITDLKWWRIPNWATYTTVLWAGALHGIVYLTQDKTLTLPTVNGTRTASTQEWLTGIDPNVGLAGFIGGFIVVALLWWVFNRGGGDVKLYAAIGSLVGIELIVWVIGMGFIVAAIAGAIHIMWVAGPLGFFSKKQMVKKTPLAPFLAVGTLLALLW